MLLKDIYSESFYRQFSCIAKNVIPGFNSDNFISFIFDKDWERKELKERMRHTTYAIHQFLPKEFPQAREILMRLTDAIEQSGYKEMSLEYMFLPDYIEVFGVDHLQESINTMERVTQLTSCEFAIRIFLIRYPETMIPQMLKWSKHPHPMVRRLASEGSRPRLPWAMAVPALKKDPFPILPILENLKSDISESVRRSVANNLNDISKDHPDLVLGTCSKWWNDDLQMEKLIKHACRTLLKKGDKRALTFFDCHDSEFILVKDFDIPTPFVQIGNELSYTFSIENESSSPQKIRLEYALYFLKANGTLSKKVFKISEKTYNPNQICSIEKRHSFRLITTRVYYPGTHKISVICNGKEFEGKEFELIS